MALIGNFELIPPDKWLFPAHGDVVEAIRRAREWHDQYGTYDGAERVIEEFVRQWALAVLAST
jgi:type I restriction enzyme M protein